MWRTVEIGGPRDSSFFLGCFCCPFCFFSGPGPATWGLEGVLLFLLLYVVTGACALFLPFCKVWSDDSGTWTGKSFADAAILDSAPGQFFSGSAACFRLLRPRELAFSIESHESAPPSTHENEGRPPALPCTGPHRHHHHAARHSPKITLADKTQKKNHAKKRTHTNAPVATSSISDDVNALHNNRYKEGRVHDAVAHLHQRPHVHSQHDGRPRPRPHHFHNHFHNHDNDNDNGERHGRSPCTHIPPAPCLAPGHRRHVGSRAVTVFPCAAAG